MRDTFSNTLVEASLRDPRVYLLTGDHGYALFDEIRKKNPSRYLNAGVAEQNMVGVAAGMAKAGLRPVVYGLSAFVPVRVLEQIKLDVCFENLPVIFIGDGAGVVYSKLGVSHQSFEDISALRALPNLHIYSPSDRHELKLCFEAALKRNGPSYIRMGKSDLGDVHGAHLAASTPGVLELKKPSGDSPVILATGSMVKLADELIEKDLKGWGLFSIPVVKPLGSDEIINAVKASRCIVTMEEHSVFGGMGSAVAEIVSRKCPKRILRIGIEDRFSDKCGTYEYLMVEHGLDYPSVLKKIQGFISEQG